MRVLALLCLIALPLPALSETLSQEIGRTGLAAVATRLSALSSPTDSERFALGGVDFLHAIEGTFQARWKMGLTDRTGMLPLLRLPLEDNPRPDPLDPAAVTAIFTNAADQLTSAQAQLAAIPATSDFGLEISLDDLWFDVNSDGKRSKGEGIADVLGAEVMGGSDDTAAPHALPTIRFDVADAAWLAAYADLLTGISDVIRAYDPTEPMTRILTARATMNKMGPVNADPFFGSGGSTGLDDIDLIAMVLATLNQTPNHDLLLQAQSHLLAVVAENRDFWSRVALEKDNDREWLPNDNQTSALGVEVPKGTGAAWLVMLDQFEAVLQGKLLVPYWRVGAPAGINVGRMLTDPRPIDLAGWIEGWDALPYLEKGMLVTPDATNAFDTLTAGEAPLFALYLN